MNLPRLLDILIPRLMTVDVAVELYYCEGCKVAHPVPICSMRDIDPGEVFDGIVAIRCFSLFGFALFPKLIGDVRPWVNPHDARKAA